MAVILTLDYCGMPNYSYEVLICKHVHLGEGKFSTPKKLMTNLLPGYPNIKQSSGSELGGGGGGGQAPPLTMQISCEVFSLYRGAVSPSHNHFLRNLIGWTLTICDVGRCVKGLGS